ncbi:conserved protein, unknown function [Hepatocystis sp. ex Piliocolobus tephrosceles]|nr:conserved protein, unknown function [Hepatocystis sp. ex Piliocolobus tephrosceles]
MKEHNTFKELIKLNNSSLRKEDILVLFFHGCILDNNFVYHIKKEETNKWLSKNDKIQFTNGFIKYITGNKDNEFIISRIILDPNWKNNSNNYNFTYKSNESNDIFNLNILKLENSLIVQVIDLASPNVVNSVTISIDEYVNDNISSVTSNSENKQDTNKLEQIINTEKLEKIINIEKLEKIFHTHVLINMIKKKNINNDINNINKCSNNQPTIFNTINPNPHKNINPQFLPNSNNANYFNDKDPIPMNNLLPNFKQGDHILKPDGLLVGPNNMFFNPQNLRYDPIGPFGQEPNADGLKHFEFQNKFPF